jgi:nucleotide-binding universal stress UspA family protein
MTYKTILVHIDDHPYAATRMTAAATMAKSFGAHLSGLASTGVDRYLDISAMQDPASPAIVSCVDTLRQRAKNALADFSSATHEAGVLDVEIRQTDADATDALAGAAAYADLCVVGHCGKQARPDGQRREMVADLTTASGCPVLAIPGGVSAAFPFQRILVAWNGSREAWRAVHSAMPFLQRGYDVEVAVMGDALEARHELLPAVEVGKLLARHGVASKVLQRPNTSDVGHALLELAGDHAVDLIVMGCYGHSRMREMLLGGATRSVLLASTIPVFMCA